MAGELENERRMLQIHAHPDDETITSGAAMARYAAAGAQVTLLTCTLGEEGEVLVPELAHLGADQGDTLGEHRMGELSRAMGALGVSDFRLLGEPGKYRDSGMMGTPSNDKPNCLWRADLLEAATDAVRVIREVRPNVLVTYDDFGGYGHPDHIQAHRVAMYGMVLAESATFRTDLGDPWSIPKVYWTAFPRSVFRAAKEQMREVDAESDFAQMDVDDLPFLVHDDLVTTQIETGPFLEHKVAAMHAYATQIDMESGFFALQRELVIHEHFRCVRGTPVREDGQRESDLFAGL